MNVRPIQWTKDIKEPSERSGIFFDSKFHGQRRKRTAKFLNYRGKFWTIFQCDDWLEWIAEQIKTVQEIRANADLVDYTQTDFFLLVSSHNPYFQSKFQAWISVMQSCRSWLKQMRRNRVASQSFKQLVPAAPTPPKMAIIRHFNHKKKTNFTSKTVHYFAL